MAVTAITALMAISSCNAIYDDLPECVTGARLRFIYDYNMEYANSFMRNVDCLTVYFYDTDGKHVATRIVNGPELADENYRMIVDLPAGDYRAIAYGGIDCDKASFAHPNGAPEAGDHYTSLSLKMNPEPLAAKPEKAMHDLFWGTVDFTITETLGEYTEATVEMIKDTNNIRIVLQHVNGKPVDPTMFNWEIIDDNTLMDHKNLVVKNGNVTYNPWTTGTTVGGFMDNGDEITDGYAELSVGRLVTTNSPQLRITRVKDGGTVLDYPLLRLLMQLRSEKYADMPPQEFLDRESDWSMLFLLNENDVWHKTEIIVNDWTVRVNDIEQ